MNVPDLEQASEILKHRFGYDSFRMNREAANLVRLVRLRHRISFPLHHSLLQRDN